MAEHRPVLWADFLISLRGHWRETWATLSLLTYFMVALYLLVMLIGWLAIHVDPWHHNPFAPWNT